MSVKSACPVFDELTLNSTLPCQTFAARVHLHSSPLHTAIRNSWVSPHNGRLLSSLDQSLSSYQPSEFHHHKSTDSPVIMPSLPFRCCHRYHLIHRDITNNASRPSQPSLAFKAIMANTVQVLKLIDLEIREQLAIEAYRSRERSAINSWLDHDFNWMTFRL